MNPNVSPFNSNMGGLGLYVPPPNQHGSESSGPQSTQGSPTVTHPQPPVGFTHLTERQMLVELYEQLQLLRVEVGEVDQRLRGVEAEAVSGARAARNIQNIVDTIPGGTVLDGNGNRTLFRVPQQAGSQPAAPQPLIQLAPPTRQATPVLQRVPPPPPPAPRAPIPPPALAVVPPKLEEFCIKCSMYLDTYDPNMHPKTKINFVIGYLEGDAQKWLNPYLVEEGTNPGTIHLLNNWQAFWEHAILPALVENVPVPIGNLPEFIDNPLAPIDNPLAPIDNPLAHIDNPLAPIENLAPVENLPAPVENLPPADVQEPHFPGHLPEVAPVEDVPAIALVEVVGIVPAADTSSLFLSLFGI
ncbi:hypothetical protein RSAG8_06184, partial [Rhizoctonia solani AG-8 WAC10335]